MLSLILAAIAGSIVAPELRPETMDRVMRQVVRVGSGSMAAWIELTVGPDGGLLDCILEHHEGDERAAERVCEGMKRARFDPATNSDGVASYGKTAIVIVTGQSHASAPMLPVMVLQVPQLLDDKTFLDVRVNVQFDAMGAFSGCSYFEQEPHIAYAQEACAQWQEVTVDPFRDPENNAVPFVQMLTVRFALAGV